jgi:hypothetical protein
MALLELIPPAIALVVGAKILYALYLHPLARAGIPGPWYAAIGDYWSEFSQLSLHYSRDIQKLLDKYGPVVRIAENKVIFMDNDAQSYVYSAKNKLPRDRYYKRFVTGGNDHSMTILYILSLDIRWARNNSPIETMRIGQTAVDRAETIIQPLIWVLFFSLL